MFVLHFVSCCSVECRFNECHGAKTIFTDEESSVSDVSGGKFFKVLFYQSFDEVLSLFGVDGSQISSFCLAELK
jgi:hypothetical protein